MARRIVLPKAQAWRYELMDFVRGMSGGFLFGIPLLYTMEAWWIGSYTDPPKMLAVLAVAYGVVFLLNRTDGFRELRPDSFRQAAMDSVEAIAIAVLCAFSVLVLLQQITPQTPLDEALGKIIIEGMPFAVGVALARSILQEGDEKNTDSQSSPQPNDQSEEASADEDQGNPAAGPLIGPPTPTREALRDIGATLVGAIILASNIAPTDEVSMLEAAITPPWLLVMIGVSLVLSYCIVFAAGFAAQRKRRQQQGIFQRPITETVITYLVSLLSATLMLWFFHRVGPGDPWSLWFKQTIILGLPATIGGAAGRLAI